MRTATAIADTMDSLLRLPKKRKMEIAERLWLSVADERTAPAPAATRKSSPPALPLTATENPFPFRTPSSCGS